jgi:uncharacterized membrane protein YphA (DoxX/SURF4 family)
MKILTTIARILLGLVFVVFGLNAFLHFLPMPMPSGLAGDFMKALFVSHYLYAIKCFEITGGILLLIGRFVPLGITLVGPVVVNILFFHAFLAPAGLPLALVIVALEGFLIVSYRSAFAGIFRA